MRAPRMAIPLPATAPSLPMSAGAIRTVPVSTSSNRASPARSVIRLSAVESSPMALGPRIRIPGYKVEVVQRATVGDHGLGYAVLRCDLGIGHLALARERAPPIVR